MTFFSIWQHIKVLPSHKKAVLVQWTWSHLGGPTQNNPAFKPLNHKEFGFSFQDLTLFKLRLGPHF